MAAKGPKKVKFCSGTLNLPEEMETALRHYGGLDELKALVPQKKSLVPESRVFHALSDPIRLQILHALLIIDLCPCLLKEITELSDSKLSYHLNILEEARLIVSSPRKRWRIYILTEQGRSLVTD
jgi:ArsR family transcriptional regulator